MNIELKEVTNKVIEILRRIQPSSDCIDEDHMDSLLTGTEMNFQDYEMAYIVLELMDFYKIEFDKDDFTNYKFNSIRNISEIVYNKLSSY